MSNFHVPFGKIDAMVSRLGLGTVKFGRNQKVKNACGDGFELPSDDAILELLDIGIEQGINLIDTAPAYGSTEERLGKLMGVRRERVFLMTKTGETFQDNESIYDFSRAGTLASVERSLRLLRTDRLDCVMVHCHRDDIDIIRNTPVLETLQLLKKKGDIRSFGVSTMTLEGGLEAATCCDAVMVPFNADYTDHLPVIQAAAERGIAIVVKKGFGSGFLSVEGGHKRCIEAIVALPGNVTVTVGTINQIHLQQNIHATKAVLGLTV